MLSLQPQQNADDTLYYSNTSASLKYQRIKFSNRYEL